MKKNDPNIGVVANQTPQGKRQNSQAFDCFRALAVTSIMLGHFASAHPEMPSFLNGVMILPFYYGVPIFFIISGYLLTASFQSIQEKYPKLKTAYSIFIKKRIYRIYPAYFVALMVMFIANPSNKMDLLTHALNVHNFWQAYHRSINPVFWSLGVEFQWYFIAPLLILLIIGSRPTFCWIILSLLLIVSVLLRHYLIVDYIKSPSFASLLWRNEQVAVYLYSFALGIIMFRMSQIRDLLLSRGVVRFLWICLITRSLYGHIHFNLHDEPIYNPIKLYVFCYTEYLAEFALVALLFYYRHLTIDPRFLSKGIQYSATVSYGLYLWHLPVLNFVNTLDISIISKFVYFVAGSFVVASISYFTIELYFIRLKEPRQADQAFESPQAH